MKDVLSEYVQYLRDNPKGYWFKRKLYGWGWTPATWQGWALTGLYIVSVVYLGLRLDTRAPVMSVLPTFFVPLILLTVLLISMAYLKGEPPRWQWGNPSSAEEK